jgi:hypothetical protein
MIPSLSESRSSGRNPFFWAGYTMSYFLIAVNDHGLGVHRSGYNCALLALLGPPLLLRVSHPYTDNFLGGLSAILMFFINPAFFLFVVIQFTVQIERALVFFKSLILCSIPMCWVFFFYSQWQPREGHVLWVLGMLLVLFAGKPFKTAHPNILLFRFRQTR